MPPPDTITSTKGRAAARRLEFGDALVFPYALVLTRQCFWAVESDAAAWGLALALAALLWAAYLRAKPTAGERTPRLFWAVVALPLLLVYATRLAFPDLSFDVLNHRLLQSERALRGAQLMEGDFFPTIFPFNPTPDMLTGLARHLLGYRLGTVVNLLALVWAGAVLERLLRSWVRPAALRCLGVLLALFVEQALFQVNSYMVDLLALPLLLEALRRALWYDESETRGRDLLVAALLLGSAVALKLTHAALVVPILAVFAVRVFSRRLDARTLGLVLLSALCFAAPLLPHALYIYHETGNPFFPLYNNLIRSPLWPHITPYDGRWGPQGWAQTLLWPVLAAWRPERLSELGVYSGRLTLGFLAAALCLVLPRAAARARLLALVVLLGSLLWSLTSGYLRYAIFAEVTGGALLIYLSHYLYVRAARWPRAPRLAAAAMPWCVLLVQCGAAADLVSRTEWSKRPTIADDAGAFRRELRWVWRDRELLQFQTEEDRALFGGVDAWVVSGVKSNGVQVLLRPDVPMLAVNNLEYFGRRRARARFARALEALRGRRVYSLCLTEDLDTARGHLIARGLTVVASRSVLVNFFSARTRLHMTLIEVGLPPPRERPRRGPDAPEVTAAAGPLDDEAFDVQLRVAAPPTTLRPGEKVTIVVTVRNVSGFIWPARGRPDGRYAVNVTNLWLDGDGATVVNNMDGRSALPRDLWPGESADVPLQITAPARPDEYLLELDLVQEGVTFFKDRDSEPARYRMRVE